MSLILNLSLYGNAAAKENARRVLENQSYVRRMNCSDQQQGYRVILNEPIKENILIPLLAACGLGGIRIHISG